MKKLFALLTLLPTLALAATPGFPDLAGKPHTLDQYRGQPLVVNYWATWCSPCRQEMPELIALQKKYAGQVQFVGIAIDETKPVAAFIKPLGINYPILIGGDDGTKLMRSQGNTLGGLPFTAVFDRNGKQVGTFTGRIHSDQLESSFKPLL